MSAIPVHIQRRFEQRWAARLVPPGAFISPTNLALEPKNSSPRGAGVAQQRLTKKRLPNKPALTPRI